MMRKIFVLVTCLMTGCATVSMPPLNEPSGLIQNPETMKAAYGFNAVRVAPGIVFTDYDSVVFPTVRTTFAVDEKYKDNLQVLDNELRKVLERNFSSVVKDRGSLSESNKAFFMELVLTSIRENPVFRLSFDAKITDVKSGKELAAFSHTEADESAKDSTEARTNISFLRSFTDDGGFDSVSMAWAGRFGDLLQVKAKLPDQKYGYVVGYFKVVSKLEVMPFKLPSLEKFEAQAYLPRNKETITSGFYKRVKNKLEMPEGYFVWKVPANKYDFPHITLVHGIEFLEMPFYEQVINVQPGEVIYIGHHEYSIGPFDPGPVISKITKPLNILAGGDSSCAVYPSVKSDRKGMLDELKKKIPDEKYVFIEQLPNANPKRIN